MFSKSIPADYLGRFVIGSPEWVEARKDGLGGSEIAAIAGLSPWKSKSALWYEKTGVVVERKERPHLWWGTAVEDVIAQRWVEQEAARHVMKTGMWRSKIWQFMYADPDRFIVPTARSKTPVGILEIKTTHDFNAHEWGKYKGNEAIPPYYNAQIQWYLAAFGLSDAVCAVVIGQGDYREYPIRASAIDQKFLIDLATDFMDSIRNNTPPVAEGDNATYQALRALHADIDPAEDIEIDYETAYKFLESRENLSYAESEYNTIRNQLTAQLGRGQSARYQSMKIATRQARGDRPPFLIPARTATLEQLENQQPLHV